MTKKESLGINAVLDDTIMSLLESMDGVGGAVLVV